MSIVKRNKKTFGQIIRKVEVQVHSSPKADVEVDDLFKLSFTKALNEELAEDNKWNIFLAVYGAAIMLGGFIFIAVCLSMDYNIKSMALGYVGAFFIGFGVYIFLKNLRPSSGSPEIDLEIEVHDD